VSDSISRRAMMRDVPRRRSVEYHSAIMPQSSRRSPRKRGEPKYEDPTVAVLPRRILIADHATLRLPNVAAELTASGHTVIETADVLATLEAIQERRPDLIVLSPLSTNLLGQEVRRVIDAKDREQQTALVIVAESPVATDVIDRLGGSLDDLLDRTKLDATELRRRIALALSRIFVTRRLEEEKLSLERQSITDFKTGTYNDRYFHRRMREEFQRAQRHRLPLSCIMLDFDNFKEINENFDHTFGDFVLLAFARKVRATIREIDIAARFGGDEFVVLLPNTGLEEAVNIAERIRKTVTDYSFEHDKHATKVTLSLGIASFDGRDEITPEEFLRRADCALLEAKRRGRDRVVLFPQIAGKSYPESVVPYRREGRDAAARDTKNDHEELESEFS
jgi:two-component system, cell cycle response regulator